MCLQSQVATSTVYGTPALSKRKFSAVPDEVPSTTRLSGRFIDLTTSVHRKGESKGLIHRFHHTSYRVFRCGPCLLHPKFFGATITHIGLYEALRAPVSKQVCTLVEIGNSPRITNKGNKTLVLKVAFPNEPV